MSAGNMFRSRLDMEVRLRTVTCVSHKAHSSEEFTRTDCCNEVWSPVKPTALIATSATWFPTVRLAMALANAGFQLDAFCPRRHPLLKTRAIQRYITYRGLIPLKSLEAAIDNTKPDLIIAGDDLITRHLQDLYLRKRKLNQAGEPICALIERSLGAPESFPVPYARAAFMELARQEGIRVPRTEVVKSIDELNRCMERLRFPLVLKSDGSSSGEGVRIVFTLEEGIEAFHALRSPPILARALKRAIFDNDTTLVRPCLFRVRGAVNAQEHIAGREATSTVACWRGEVLASLHFEVIKKRDSTGPSTVLRLIDNAEMATAVEKIVHRMKLSGMHGFDFMLEPKEGNAYLIEINPRATQVGHLTLGPGRDLPAGLFAAVTGEAVREAPKVSDKDTIALFPQEWLRDPTSAFLQSGFHDVPWEEPDFIRECIRRRRSWAEWYSRQKALGIFAKF